MIYDVLIVGSGASAVNAAFPLVESGLSVAMLDFGNEDQTYRSLIPNAPFFDIRKTDPAQHRYFLGDHFEGVPLSGLRAGPQLTPPRQYVTKDTEELMPFDSRGFLPLSTLAMGGLASGWAAGAFPYCERDLKDFPIPRKELAPHYEIVAERIGISGEVDDLTPFEGELKALLPPLKVDRNGTTLLERYQRRRAKMNAAGFHMGKPKLAALSQPHRGRGPEQYHNMSFWGDADQSVWRPAFTLKELIAFRNFTYLRPFLVRSFKERDDRSVEIHCLNMKSGAQESFQGRRVILASGLFSTARIVLRSLNKYRAPDPLVCNPYIYFPMLSLNMIGQPPEDENHSLAQLCVIYDPQEPGAGLLHGRIHSYRSLLNFKVIKEMPLPFREGMKLMKILAPCLAVLALDHEDRPSPDKYIRLHPGASGAPDCLEVVFRPSQDVEAQRRRYEKRVLRHLRSLGCIPLKRVWPGYGVSIHYGGSFPMTLEEKELTVNTNGLLRGTRSVYIVDGSVLPYLPSKGMTFTLMANANRIGDRLAKELA